MQLELKPMMCLAPQTCETSWLQSNSTPYRKSELAMIASSGFLNLVFMNLWISQFPYKIGNCRDWLLSVVSSKCCQLTTAPKLRSRGQQLCQNLRNNVNSKEVLSLADSILCLMYIEKQLNPFLLACNSIVGVAMSILTPNVFRDVSSHRSVIRLISEQRIAWKADFGVLIGMLIRSSLPDF